MQIFREFLHPHYWLKFDGVLWLWAASLSCLCFLGTVSAQWRDFLKRRESIARKTWNFVPQHSAKEREKMIAENFRFIGMALVETSMAWFCPTVAYVNGLMWSMDNLKRAQMQNRGIWLSASIFMSLELGGRDGVCQPMMATYRPHNNQLMEWVQTRGRI